MTAEYQVTGALLLIGTAVHIAAVTFCALREDQRTAVRTLADRFVGSGQIDDHIRTGQCMQGARRDRYPQILADIDADDSLCRLIADEQMRREGNRLSLQNDRLQGPDGQPDDELPVL